MKMQMVLTATLLLTFTVRAEYKELTELKDASYKTLSLYSERLSGADSKFDGVVNFGKALKKVTKDKEIEIDKLTSENKDYWRAVMEMAPTDPSVLLAHGYLHAARGEVAYAEVYFMLGGLTMDKTFADEMDEFKRYSGELSKRLESNISRGIKANDNGQYRQAIMVYDKVISEYSNCAWAYYEKGFTYMIMGSANKKLAEKKEQMFAECRRCNPFYWQAYQGSDPEVISKLTIVLGKIQPFAEGKKRDVNSFKDFAQGCEEMGLYSFAAHSYWKLAHLDSGNNKDHISKFLDMLGKCGCEDVGFFRSQFDLPMGDSANADS